MKIMNHTFAAYLITLWVIYSNYDIVVYHLHPNQFLTPPNLYRNPNINVLMLFRLLNLTADLFVHVNPFLRMACRRSFFDLLSIFIYYHIA